MEEMQALDDNSVGTWYSYLLGRKPLDSVGFLQLKLILMVPLLN